MTHEATKPISIKHSPVTQSVAKGAAPCLHFTADDGTRCRLPILDASSHLCFRHAPIATDSQSSQNDYEDLSAELLPELSEFAAGADIRQFLARLLVLVTKGRISPRRASVLGYITNQLLHSHRAIALEAAPPVEAETRIVIDMPRPDRD